MSEVSDWVKLNSECDLMLNEIDEDLRKYKDLQATMVTKFDKVFNIIKGFKAMDLASNNVQTALLSRNKTQMIIFDKLRMSIDSTVLSLYLKNSFVTSLEATNYLYYKGFKINDKVKFRVENQDDWRGPTEGILKLDNDGFFYIQCDNMKITINLGHDAYLGSIEKIE